MVAATLSDTQPPSSTFTALARKKPESMMPNSTASASAPASFHAHCQRMTTNSRMVVISISPVTEMP